MPANYIIYPEHNFQYSYVTGETNLEELRAIALRYRHDPAYSPEIRQLVDLTNLTDAKAPFSDVLTLRNFYLRTFGPVDKPIPIAILAPTDLGYGIAKMFTSIMIGQKLMRISVTSTPAQAQEWLGGSFPKGLFDDDAPH